MPKAARFSHFTPFLESGPGLKPSVKEAGGGRVYRGVTIIRAGLGNRRDMNFYPESAIKEAVSEGQFEGLKAYADHPTSVDEQIQPERTVRDFVGLYTNAKFVEGRGGKPGRAVGDLRILKSHRWLSDVVDELIEIGQADKIGISINGNGRTERKSVREAGEEMEANVVTKFMTMRSADVVTEAGAGGGFQQILESARESQETTMSRKAILKALREAADAGDTDRIDELNTQLKECGCVAEADEAAGGKKKTTRRTEESTGADEAEDDDDAVDHDTELDDATREAAGGEGDEAEDDDEAEDTDDADDLDESDADDAEGAEGESTEGDENTRRAEGARNAVKKLRQHKEARGPLAKGAAPAGKGSFVKKTKGGRGHSNTGQRFGETDRTGIRDTTTGSGVNRLEIRDENVRLKRALAKEKQRNERLAESLGTHRRADLARKLLKESGVPVELRPALVKRLVRSCPGGDLREAQKYMESEIDFHQRLMESVAGRAADAIESDFDEVEGAGGSRFRESYGGGGEGDDDEIVGMFRESGLPMKAAKK